MNHAHFRQAGNGRKNEPLIFANDPEGICNRRERRGNADFNHEWTLMDTDFTGGNRANGEQK